MTEKKKAGRTRKPRCRCHPNLPWDDECEVLCNVLGEVGHG